MPEVVAEVRRLRHRRIPVYREHRDTLVGMLHAEDIMQLALEGRDFSQLTVESLLHPVTMVPPTKKVDEMFEFFLQHHSQAAIVLNEFGGVDGLVTLKGLVNFIFGHASGEEPLRELFSEPEEGVFEVDGGMKLGDFNAVTNFGIVDRRMTTISGVVLRHLDRPPTVGDQVVVEGIRLQVLSVDGHRIERVRAMAAAHPVVEEGGQAGTKRAQANSDESEGTL
jgi:CBS domain containing-hemolysin-like protein